jgi:hypothetical protein
MSQSLAAAKKRRAPIQPTEPANRNMSSSMPPGQSAPSTQNGLTLPQVIQIVDRRLIVLESFMNETKTANMLGSSAIRSLNEPVDDTPSTEIPANLAEIIEEFDKRYELLAEEIVNIKNIVLSLQSYTMDVNKMLLEERSQMFPNEMTNGTESDAPAADGQ